MDPKEEAQEKLVMKWYSQGKYEKIIKAVEKMNPHTRSTAMDALLAHSYTATSSGWKDRGNNLKAVSLLKNLEEEFENTKTLYLHNLWLGDAYMALEQYNTALKYYLNAREIGSDSHSRKKLNDKIFVMDHKRSFPVFTEPFKERVKRAWAEFEKREAEFRNIIDKDPEEKRKEEVTTKIQSVLQIAMTDILISFRKSDGRYYLQFAGFAGLTINPMRIFEVEYLTEHCPSSVLQNWNIVVGIPPHADREWEEDIPKKMKIWVKKEKSGLFSLELYSKLDPEECIGIQTKLDNLQLFTLILATLLGEICMAKFLDLSKILNEPKYDPYLLAEDLPRFLKHNKIDVSASIKHLLNQEIRYTRKLPKNWNERVFRDDVVSGESKFVKLLLDYDQENEEIVNHLEADGVIVGSLYFNHSKFTGESKDELIRAIKDEIKRYLIENVGEDGFLFLGESHGKVYEYIDILVWDSTKLFEAIIHLPDLLESILYFHVFIKTAIEINTHLERDEEIKNEIHKTVAKMYEEYKEWMGE